MLNFQLAKFINASASNFDTQTNLCRTCVISYTYLNYTYLNYMCFCVLNINMRPILSVLNRKASGLHLPLPCLIYQIAKNTCVSHALHTTMWVAHFTRASEKKLRQILPLSYKMLPWGQSRCWLYSTTWWQKLPVLHQMSPRQMLPLSCLALSGGQIRGRLWLNHVVAQKRYLCPV